jgi:hypothetical protein
MPNVSHRYQIQNLRQRASELRRDPTTGIERDPMDTTTGCQSAMTEAAAYETAAALLEEHDATGISLDNWTGPRELVNRCLSALGWVAFTPNGV